MAYKPSTHPKKYDLRNKNAVKTKEVASDFLSEHDNWARQTKSDIEKARQWVATAQAWTKDAAAAAKSMRRDMKIFSSNFEKVAKLTAEIMALEAQIESIGKPKDDAEKAKLKRLIAEHAKKDKLCSGFQGLKNNASALIKQNSGVVQASMELEKLYL